MAIDLPLDENQALLLGSVERYLADHDRPAWAALAADLGLMSIGVPEAAGGFGGGAVERAVVAAALAPSLAAADWLPHTVAASLLARVAPANPLLPALASGELRIVLIDAAAHGLDMAAGLSGTATLVPGGSDATHALVLGDSAVLLVNLGAQGATATPRAMLDGTESADIAFALPAGAGEVIATGAAAAALAELGRDTLYAGRCAEACGLMGRMMQDTIAFLGQRKQFGQPIASFQVLRHRIADMQMVLMKAAALTEAAIMAEADDPATRRHAASAACIEVFDAVRLVGEGAVQMHGAMGLTDELTLGRFYKRALAIGAGIGPTRLHYARL